MTPRRSRLLAALAAFALLACLAAYRALRFTPRRSHVDAEFPTAPSTAERAASAAASAPGSRDPFLVAIPPLDPSGARVALVVRAKAMWPTPMGRILRRCLERGGAAARWPSDVGFPLDAIDRLAFSDDMAILDGNFAGAKLAGAFRAEAQAPHGPRATVYTRPAEGAEDQAVARWGDHILLNGRVSLVRAAIDRMDATDATDAPRPAIPDDLAYGDVYGAVAMDLVAPRIADGLPELAGALSAAGDRVEIHVASGQDLLITASVRSADPGGLARLNDALKGALLRARLGARAMGDDDIVGFAESARVLPSSDAARVAAALPTEGFERWLSHCFAEAPPASR